MLTFQQCDINHRLLFGVIWVIGVVGKMKLHNLDFAWRRRFPSFVYIFSFFILHHGGSLARTHKKIWKAPNFPKEGNDEDSAAHGDPCKHCG
jgi:hypothetical protein